MNHTEILLCEDTSQEDKIRAANVVMQICNFHLSVEKILQVHSHIKNCQRHYNSISLWCLRNVYRRPGFLFNTLLNTNVDLYIAIILALNEDRNAIAFKDVMQSYGKYNYKIGYNSGYGKEYCINVYSKLLDYHNFDVTDLNMPDDIKEEIKKRSLHKYPKSILTKRAVK